MPYCLNHIFGLMLVGGLDYYGPLIEQGARIVCIFNLDGKCQFGQFPRIKSQQEEIEMTIKIKLHQPLYKSGCPGCYPGVTSATPVAWICEDTYAVVLRQDGGHRVEVMELCQRAGVPAGVVQNVMDFVERDPQLMRSGFMHTIDSSHPTVGTTYADKLPLQFQATPCDIYERPREIGEDNLVVLQDWIDMSEDEIQKAKESGILS